MGNSMAATASVTTTTIPVNLAPRQQLYAALARPTSIPPAPVTPPTLTPTPTTPTTQGDTVMRDTQTMHTELSNNTLGLTIKTMATHFTVLTTVVNDLNLQMCANAAA